MTYNTDYDDYLLILKIMNSSLLKIKFLLFTFFLILYTSPAFAYLDPGTGSILIQGLIGGFAATVAFGSIYWQKVKAFFSKDISNKDNSDKD